MYAIKRLAGPAALATLAVGASAAWAQQPASSGAERQPAMAIAAPSNERAATAERDTADVRPTDVRPTPRIAAPEAMPNAKASLDGKAPAGNEAAPTEPRAVDGSPGTPPPSSRATTAASEPKPNGGAVSNNEMPPPAAGAGKPSEVLAGAAKPDETIKDRTAAAAAAAAASRAAVEKADKENEEGISDEARIVQPILAKHPDSNIIICIAGCGPQPSIVQVMPREAETRTESQVVPSSGRLGGDDAATPNASAAQPDTADVICLAGCLKKRGDVVHRKAKVSWLTPQQSEAMKQQLRRIAERFGADVFPVADAESRAAFRLGHWSRMGRSVVERGIKVADRSDE